MPNYCWIAFDAVGTLIYPAPDVATAYAQIGHRHGSQRTISDLRSRFRSVFAESAAMLPVVEGNIITSEELERARWQWIVKNLLPDVTDPAACFTDLYDHFARPESWQLFDDVADTLRELTARGVHLAIASNFDARLHAVCRGLPELRGVEKIIVSTEAGAAKPSPRFFVKLLETCGCGAGELLMVGDDLEADVMGPERIGIAAVRIDRETTELSQRTIRSLRDVLSVG